MSYSLYANAVATESPGGFLWYQDPLKKIIKKSPEDKSKDKQTSVATKARARNDVLKKELDDAIQVVVDNPTLDNAIKAQRMQKQVMDRSEQVSKAWVLAALVDAGIVKPDINPNVLHRALARKDKVNNDLATLKLMAKSWGLLLYVMPGCKYCEKFVPIIEQLRQETGFQILAISESGGNYGPFAGKQDIGLMQHLNPEKLAPVLYLVNKDGKRVYPVARGLTDIQQVKSNILLVQYLETTRQAESKQ